MRHPSKYERVTRPKFFLERMVSYVLTHVGNIYGRHIHSTQNYISIILRAKTNGKKCIDDDGHHVRKKLPHAAAGHLERMGKTMGAWQDASVDTM